ncbi:hypothetical protein COCCADRAFT_40542 [Bipolaris zeicola 26-R-13]|uniref:DUF7918 domain-containing protein n=1 Tax=Cochliobolus carbonum (strain 26-R-13) TaxID=930089 RepID=W6YD06_COCC2|nr:uncharacterized protein COCCADRAFT_40542 [Bipolaris zeicola 26-R-13]EUC29041.1 hypothetical protein COCCADRAFT_40542 [Bipolaris zeicola 26-R-13]
MPSLKDLNCSIELSQPQHALPEYGTIYGDGFVETFVPIPNQPQSFSIHLTSNTFIAPGIAIFVYVDGIYQCNRNRQNIKPRKLSDSRSLVDFRVRQKEERQKDGSMIAREWTFDNLDIASADDASNLHSPATLDNIGCIEVVVLRCAGSRDTKSASAINLDGAGDWPDHRFSLGDSPSSHNRSMYDDRGPFLDNSHNISGPPAPWSSYRAPYAETLQSHESSKTHIQYNTLPVRDKSSRVFMTRHSTSGSRCSEAMSPRARRLESLPSSGFQYGSGPIPPDRKVAHRDDHMITTPETSGVDPVWLRNVLKTAVKQGVEESRRVEAQSARHDRDSDHSSQKEDKTSQAPGAWPESPHTATVQVPHSFRASPSKRNQRSDRASDWVQSPNGWGQVEIKSKTGAHANQSEDHLWETEISSYGNGWHSCEETPSDSWDTDETWGTSRGREWKDSSQLEIPLATIAAPYSNAQIVSRASSYIHPRRRSTHTSRRHQSRSKSQSRLRKRDETSLEYRRWAGSASPAYSTSSSSSSDNTIQPSHSRSHIQTLRKRSKSRACPSKSTQSYHGRTSSRYPLCAENLKCIDSEQIPAPSAITRAIPDVQSHPDIALPTHTQSRRPSRHDYGGISASGVPAWPAAVNNTSNMFPAPYAPSAKEYAWEAIGSGEKDRHSIASSTWDSNRVHSWAVATSQDSTWATEKPKSPGKNAWYSTSDDEDGDIKWTIPPTGHKSPEPTRWQDIIKPTPPSDAKKSKSKSKYKKNDSSALQELKGVLEMSLGKEQKNGGMKGTNVSRPAIHEEKDEKDKKAKQPGHTTTPHRHKCSKSPTKSRVQPPKPHWRFPPPPPPASLLPSPSSQSAITAAATSKKGTKHFVHTSTPIPYGHAIARPEYVDSLEMPYAVFRFKYRSLDALKKLGVLGGDLEEAKKDWQ